METAPPTHTSSSKKWIDYVIATTPQVCLKHFGRNNSLIDNLGQVFASLCRTLRTLYSCGDCLHTFINKSMPEAHVLYPTGRGPYFERLTLSGQQYEALKQLTKWDKHSDKNVDSPEIFELKPEELSELVRLLSVQPSLPPEGTGILVPFDFAELNLGVFVLWGQRGSPRGQQQPENEQLRGWVASTYFFLKAFFEREYAMVSRVTYLPSLYAARWNQAAILVADIKNFTPLTQIVRVIRTSQQEKQDTGVLRRILNEHCREMASIIQEDGRGRIDRFFGAGVMAIFGEHEVNPVKATTTAVYVAAKLVQRFRTLKNRFLEQAFGVGYDTDYSESVNIDLSVGIDFGTVLFDYLGDENHREYTVIGDHVNFAKRLEYEALRVDEAGHLRQPILISPTVERCIRPWIHQCATCVVRGREMDYACTAHGLFPQDLDEAKFMYSWETNDWTGSWESTGWSPPSAVFES